MLRELKSKQLKNRVSFFRTVSTATPSITASIGAGDATTLTRSGGLSITLPLRNPYRQNAVYIASQTNNNGGFVEDSGGVSASSLGYRIINNAASVTDGTANILAIGPDSVTTDALPMSNVKCTMDRSRLMWGKISAAGAVTIGASGVSVVRSATGVYDITYKDSFKRTALAFATPIGAAYRGYKVTNQTAAGCTISIHDATPTAQNNDFYFLIAGTDSREETTRGNGLLQNGQRLPKIEAFQYIVSGGVETVTVGSKIATLTNNGAGDNTITIAEPFKREFATFALSGPGASKVQAVVQAANSSSATRIQTYSVAGALTDPSGSAPVNVIVIGSMDPSEY